MPEYKVEIKYIFIYIFFKLFYYFIKNKMFQTLKLTDIWRTCNKIRAAIFRSGLNLWDYYKPLDPKENGLISGRIKF